MYMKINIKNMYSTWMPRSLGWIFPILPYQNSDPGLQHSSHGCPCSKIVAAAAATKRS